jgi:hypothetical protein
MKILTLLLVWGAGSALAQTPDVAVIMAKVGANQNQAEGKRREYVYTQKQTLRMIRPGGKVAREEHREYTVTPKAAKTLKELTHFDGRYQAGSKYVSYDRPEFRYKGMDIDGDLINSLSDDLANDKGSRDGLAANLFPLTERLQKHYQFLFKGAETYRGHPVYRVSFEPAPKESLLHDENDEAGIWKGEALIDSTEFQPVAVHTSLAFKIPTAVKILLGTNISGLGYAVSYEKFDDGVWFPVSYGGEFHVRGLFFYSRTMSVSLVNRDFRKLDVNSKIVYTDDRNQ